MTIFRLHFPAPLDEPVCSRIGRLMWNFLHEITPRGEDQLFGAIERESLPCRVVKPGGHLGYICAEIEVSHPCDADLREKILSGTAKLLHGATKTPPEAILIKLRTDDGTFWMHGDGQVFHPKP